MTKENVLDGAYLLSEIEALQNLRELFEPFFNIKHMENNEKVKPISLLGTDFGKPNATKLMTTVAYNNRQMCQDIEKLIDKRITLVKSQLNEL